MDNMEQVILKSLQQMALNGPIILLKWVMTEDKPLVEQITPNVEHIFGYTSKQLVSGEVPLFSIIDKDDLRYLLESMTNALASKSHFWESSFRINACGEVKFVKAFSYIEQVSKNNELSIVSYFSEETTVINQSSKQISFDNRWETAIMTAGEGVWDIHLQSCIVFFSKHWKGMLGFEEHEIPNEYNEWIKRIHPDDLEETQSLFIQHVQNETDYFESKHRLLHKNGTYRWILCRGKAVERYGNGIAIRLIGTHVDITEHTEMKSLLLRRNEELELLVERTKELAVTDPLTSLFNRRKMMEEIKKAKDQFIVNEQTFTLAILDLDYFKQINDKYGHTFGDIALQTFSNLLKKKVEPPNVIARWGGEEFILLFPDKNMQQTKRVLTSLQACCNEELLRYRSESVMLTFSAGVCEYIASYLKNDIIKKADQALYLAKSLGRNQIVLYDEGLPIL
ncbi:sensor domain-containing diguanylate cyclase [Paenisporosarcina indica]|uniref:sensor domain-containing diguanylate cyclase n=1 Tax=Paenisporosarcina indica TaxID=650093 RepID=UPI000950275B|nr:diguanylate cyclase [Paenisporosarcina indica]